METAKFLKILGIFSTFVAIVFSSIFLLYSSYMKSQYNIDDNYENLIKTDGYIVDIIEPSKNENNYSENGNSKFGMVYSFKDENGNDYTVSTDLYSTGFEKDEKIEVYYEKNDPLTNIPSFFLDHYNRMSKIFLFFGILNFVPGITMIIIGFVIGNKTKKKKMALQNS